MKMRVSTPRTSSPHSEPSNDSCLWSKVQTSSQMTWASMTALQRESMRLSLKKFQQFLLPMQLLRNLQWWSKSSVHLLQRMQWQLVLRTCLSHMGHTLTSNTPYRLTSQGERISQSTGSVMVRQQQSYTITMSKPYWMPASTHRTGWPWSTMAGTAKTEWRASWPRNRIRVSTCQPANGWVQALVSQYSPSLRSRGARDLSGVPSSIRQTDLLSAQHHTHPSECSFMPAIPHQQVYHMSQDPTLELNYPSPQRKRKGQERESHQHLLSQIRGLKQVIEGLEERQLAKIGQSQQPQPRQASPKQQVQVPKTRKEQPKQEREPQAYQQPSVMPTTHLNPQNQGLTSKISQLYPGASRVTPTSISGAMNHNWKVRKITKKPLRQQQGEAESQRQIVQEKPKPKPQPATQQIKPKPQPQPKPQIQQHFEEQSELPSEIEKAQQSRAIHKITPEVSNFVQDESITEGRLEESKIKAEANNNYGVSRMMRQSQSDSKEFHFKKVDLMPVIETDHKRFQSYVTAQKSQAVTSSVHKIPPSRPRAFSGIEGPPGSVPTLKGALEQATALQLTAQTPKSELVAAGKMIFKLCLADFDEYDHLFSIKKYKNCMVFSLMPQQTKAIIWHYGGDIYVGNISVDHRGRIEKCGYGVELIRSRHYYEGYLLGGRKNGRGRIYYQSGDTYDGQWMEGEIYGFGVYSEGNKDCTYSGFWRKGEYCGQKHSYAHDPFQQL